MAYYMVSLDSPEKNAEFARSLESNFPVISDPDKSAARAYGVLGLGGLHARRYTFYVDSNGYVRKIDKNVRPAAAGADVAKTLGKLGFPLKENPGEK